MKLIDQVITLSQAKRLKELGIRQDASHAAWLRNESHGETEFWCWPVEAQGITNRGYSSPAKGCLEGFSAFSVAELGVMLPDKFQYGGEECFVDSVKYCKEYKWIAGIHTVWAHDKPVVAKKYVPADTEAEARAAMLIYLLENKLVTPEEVNARLCA